MTSVAAIQMTSGVDVARNLANASVLLREAQARGASVAALPENFAYMGLNEADKLAISEAPSVGPIQSFLAATASELEPVDRGRHDPDAAARRTARRCRVHRLRRPGSRRGALRQDPPVRRGHSRSQRVLPGVEFRATWRRTGRRGYAGGAAWARRLLRLAISRNFSASSCPKARNGSACPRPSRPPPAARTGKSCCGPGPSKISATWWPRPSPASTKTAAKRTGIR